MVTTKMTTQQKYGVTHFEAKIRVTDQKVRSCKKISLPRNLDPGCSLRHKNIEGPSYKNYCRQMKAAHQSKIMHTLRTQGREQHSIKI